MQIILGRKLSSPRVDQEAPDFVLLSGRVHNSELTQRIERLTPGGQQIPPFDPGSVSAKPDARGQFDLSDPIPEG